MTPMGMGDINNGYDRREYLTKSESKQSHVHSIKEIVLEPQSSNSNDVDAPPLTTPKRRGSGSIERDNGKERRRSRSDEKGGGNRGNNDGNETYASSMDPPGYNELGVEVSASRSTGGSRSSGKPRDPEAAYNMHRRKKRFLEEQQHARNRYDESSHASWLPNNSNYSSADPRNRPVETADTQAILSKQKAEVLASSVPQRSWKPTPNKSPHNRQQDRSRTSYSEEMDDYSSTNEWVPSEYYQKPTPSSPAIISPYPPSTRQQEEHYQQQQEYPSQQRHYYDDERQNNWNHKHQKRDHSVPLEIRTTQRKPSVTAQNKNQQHQQNNDPDNRRRSVASSFTVSSRDLSNKSEDHSTILDSLKVDSKKAASSKRDGSTKSEDHSTILDSLNNSLTKLGFGSKTSSGTKSDNSTILDSLNNSFTKLSKTSSGKSSGKKSSGSSRNLLDSLGFPRKNSKTSSSKKSSPESKATSSSGNVRSSDESKTISTKSKRDSDESKNDESKTRESRSRKSSGSFPMKTVDEYSFNVTDGDELEESLISASNRDPSYINQLNNENENDQFVIPAIFVRKSGTSDLTMDLDATREMIASTLTSSDEEITFNSHLNSTIHNSIISNEEALMNYYNSSNGDLSWNVSLKGEGESSKRSKKSVRRRLTRDNSEARAERERKAKQRMEDISSEVRSYVSSHLSQTRSVDNESESGKSSWHHRTSIAGESVSGTMVSTKKAANKRGAKAKGRRSSTSTLPSIGSMIPEELYDTFDHERDESSEFSYYEVPHDSEGDDELEEDDDEEFIEVEVGDDVEVGDSNNIGVAPPIRSSILKNQRRGSVMDMAGGIADVGDESEVSEYGGNNSSSEFFKRKVVRRAGKKGLQKRTSAIDLNASNGTDDDDDDGSDDDDKDKDSPNSNKRKVDRRGSTKNLNRRVSVTDLKSGSDDDVDSDEDSRAKKKERKLNRRASAKNINRRGSTKNLNRRASAKQLNRRGRRGSALDLEAGNGDSSSGSDVDESTTFQNRANKSAEFFNRRRLLRKASSMFLWRRGSQWNMDDESSDDSDKEDNDRADSQKNESKKKEAKDADENSDVEDEVSTTCCDCLDIRCFQIVEGHRVFQPTCGVYVIVILVLFLISVWVGIGLVWRRLLTLR